MWPAVLCGTSALRACLGDWPGGGPIQVAVDSRRTVVAPLGVVVHRKADLADHAQWTLSPPRLSLETAVLDVASSERRELDSVAVLAAAVGSRRTTAERLSAALSSRARIRRRGFLSRVIEDLATGTWSVLEHGYLDQVERPHRLPVGTRQFRHVSPNGVEYRDVDLAGLAVIELDGRQFHSSSRQRDRDLERDLEIASEGRLAIRLGWGQVFERPCATAAKVAAVLAANGWEGDPKSCGPDCALATTKSRADVTR